MHSPETECFCFDKKSLLCDYNGLIDVSPCRNQAPIVISQPHFFHGDNRLRTKIFGLRPEGIKHESYLHIEPVSYWQTN